ncbi:Hypothetical_protein [Hexamita inflata]|uniref:Hypothetical_protein n=1 Tax=Hexamita inflata TaxID=28002 RepID=A0AA86U4B6_9EUKA|nr:Hypothetical protein HINF_LOCUS27884 [Hexamita inflata]
MFNPIHVEQCQDYVFNNSEHYSEAELADIHDAINLDLYHISLYEKICEEKLIKPDYIHLLQYLKEVEAKMSSLEIANFSFQIARFNSSKITFEQLQKIVPPEFLPNLNVQNIKRSKKQREQQIEQRKIKEIQYENLQFLGSELVDNTPQITQNQKKQ